MPEQFLELDLSVGDVIQIDDHIITVLDINGPEVSIRIDDVELCLVTTAGSPEYELATLPK